MCVLCTVQTGNFVKRARKNFLFPKYARLTRGEARASSILGTLHVRFLRAYHTFRARSFSSAREGLPHARQSFQTGVQCIKTFIK